MGCGAQVLDDESAGAEVWLEGGTGLVVVGRLAGRGTVGEVYYLGAFALDFGGHCAGWGVVVFGAGALRVRGRVRL